MRVKHHQHIAMLLMIMLTMTISMQAQQVLERSAKKRPAWVGQVQENMLITSAEGKTLDEAQRKCLDAVKAQMLESVAQNVEVSSETIIEQITHNQDVSSDITFRQQGRTRVANLPYISGVSLANATEAYWEKQRNKNSGEITWTYALCYPFPVTEQHKLKKEFDEMDQGMVNRYNHWKGQLATINNVDSLEAGIAQLEQVTDYFFDNNRKADANQLRNQYLNAVKQLNIESKRLDRCKYLLRITLNGKDMKSGYLPQGKSSTATKIHCSTVSQGVMVTFSDEECVDDDDNYIDLTYRLKFRTIKHRLHF